MYVELFVLHMLFIYSPHVHGQSNLSALGNNGRLLWPLKTGDPFIQVNYSEKFTSNGLHVQEWSLNKCGL